MECSRTPAWPATYAPFCAKCCFFRGHFTIMKSFQTSINRGAIYSQKLENLARLWQYFLLTFLHQSRPLPKLQEKNFCDPNFNSSYRPHQITQEKPKFGFGILNPKSRVSGRNLKGKGETKNQSWFWCWIARIFEGKSKGEVEKFLGPS